MKGIRILVLQFRMDGNYQQISQLYTITSENYSVHFGNIYKLFKFLNEATMAIQNNTQNNQMSRCTVGRLFDC